METVNQASIARDIENMRDLVASGATQVYSYRMAALDSLGATIALHEQDLVDALQEDLGKAPYESFTTEIGQVKTEISHVKKNLKKWVLPKPAKVEFVHFPSKGCVQPQAKGIVLVMSPWNYPVNLALIPLVDAIAAGNAVVVKTSRKTPHVNKVLSAIIREAFDRNYVRYYENTPTLNDDLLANKFDHIFFTGSPRIGHIIMTAAAKNLTPVTLELGGKSPALVLPGAKLKIAARRITWGKFTNAGQTCIAPDYALVPRSMQDLLIEQMHVSLEKFYGIDPLSSPDYGHIINEAAFNRLVSYIDETPKKDIAIGGKYDRETLSIEPTVIINVDKDDPIMQSEIFGPILPLVTYDDLDHAIDFINEREKPLALYLFCDDLDPRISNILYRTSSGGAVINDTLIHASNTDLPFGGVGNSGMGAYHGYRGFVELSHMRSIQHHNDFPDIPVRYPPYTDIKSFIVRRVLR